MSEDYPLFADRFRLVRRLASGGQGEVYLAVDEGPEALGEVAIKRVLPNVGDEDHALRSFLDELRLAPQLDHPNIVRVLDHGQAEGMYYLAMEYIAGRNLAELMSRAVKTGQHIGIVAAMQIVHDIARGAHYAHTLENAGGEHLGIVHRDLGPRNVMVTSEGIAKVLDFGVAKARTQENRTLPGVVKGTPSYLAPEQLAGAPAKPVTDLFAMGIVLFELTTLRRLFRRATVLETMRAVLRCEVPKPSSLVEDYPASVEKIVLRALARRPAERYQTADDLRSDIAQAMKALGNGDARGRVASVVAALSTPPPSSAEPEGDPTDVNEVTGLSSITVTVPPAVRSNLPKSEGRLIGRDDEMRRLLKLARGKSRIITLHGPPGSGKTRMALELAARQAATYASAGGVWICELDLAQTAEDVVGVVGAALGCLPGPEEDDLVEAFGTALAARGPALVILDSAETVPRVAPRLVQRWAQQAGEARFVLTSRERLRIHGGRSLEVEPLSTRRPEGEPWSPAVELFIDRMQVTEPGFEPTPDQLAAIVRIVRRLDGIPLAVRLAASRMLDLSSATLLRDLVRRPDGLDGDAAGDGEEPGRHEALGAALEWSWALLEPWEQSALAQCSVFHSGFDMEAADAIIDLNDHPDAPWVVDVLQRLKDKSLVRSYAADDFPGEARCRQYVSIRGFSRRKLDAMGGVKEAMDRHARYYARLGVYWSSASGVEGLRRLRLDKNNLLAAHRRALIADAMSAEQAETAVDLALSLGPVIAAQGPYEAYLDVLDGLLAHREVAQLDVGRRARTLVARGHARTVRGKLQAAAEDCRAAATLGEQHSAPVLQAEALTQLGATLAQGGELDAASHALIRALRLHGTSRDPGGQGRALLHLGGVYLTWGDEVRARACFDKALPRFRTVSDPLHEALCLAQIGSLEHAFGQQQKARPRLERAIAILREIEAPRFEAYATACLGTVLHEQAFLDTARALYRRSFGLARQVGDRRWECVSTGYLALVHLQQDHAREALTLARRSVEAADRVGSKRWSAVLRGLAAAAEARAGNIEACESWLVEAERIGEPEDDPALGLLLQLGALFRRIAEAQQATTTLYRDEILKEVRRGMRRVARKSDDGPWAVHSDRMDLVRMLLSTLRRTVGD